MFNIEVVLLLVFISSISGHQWTEIPGGLKDITGSPNYLWGVSSNNNIYQCAQPCTGSWVNVPGKLSQVDANDYEVWGTNNIKEIFKRSVDGSGSWVKVIGMSSHVSASGNGHMWCIGGSKCPWRCKKPCSGVWYKVGNKCAFKQIDGGQDYVYAVNNTNHVFSRPVDGSGSWRYIPGKMQHITVGSHEIFGVDAQSEVHRCKKPCIGEWEKISFDDGDMKRCDATINGIFGVSTGGTIYYRKLP